jgi:hypothetical protein
MKDRFDRHGKGKESPYTSPYAQQKPSSRIFFLAVGLGDVLISDQERPRQMLIRVPIILVDTGEVV